jgi:hypothetical protein
MVACATEATARPGAECFDRPVRVRDDRPMVAIAERRARPKSERFDRPLRLRDGRVFLHHFPALRTGLLSPRPSGTSPQRTVLNTLS